MSSILFFLQGARRRVILSEREERARTKDLLENAWRIRAQGVVPEGRSFAPGGKQVLRACGAQDDNARSLRKGRSRNLPFLPETRGAVILSERAERARAKDLLEDAWRMRAKGASSRPREMAAGDGGDRFGE